MSESSWNEIREHEGRIKQMQYVRGLEEQIAALTKERDLLQFAVAAHERNLQEHSDALNQRGAELDRLRAEQRIPPGMTAEKLDALASWIQATRGQMVLTNADVVIKQLTEWATWVREHTEDEWTPEQLGDIAELAAEYSGPYRRLPEREQPKQFRKKPIVIEAIQWTGENLGDLLTWGAPVTILPDSNLESLIIGTLEDGPNCEAVHVATLNDWIIRGARGEFYPCKPDIFAETYSPADEQEQPIAELERITLEPKK